MTLTPSNQQFSGIKAVSDWFKNNEPNHFSLEGFAGSGKSTILPFIIEQCGIHPDEVAFCAPTGKAAKVMTSKLNGQTASTIHSLIYTPKMMKIDALVSSIDSLVLQLAELESEGEKDSELYEKTSILLKIARVDLERAYDRDEGPAFTLNLASRVAQSKLVVVDEASMVNMKMAEDIKMFGVPVLAMGDSGQLPPIDGKHGFLRNKPDFFLSEIHRQALDNPIIQLATQARKGQELQYGDYGDGVQVIKKEDDDITTNVDRNAMILAGTNRKRWQLTQKIRKAFGYTERYPCEGEPLIVCKNFRRNDALIHVNGDIVTCAEDSEPLDKGSASFLLEFTDSEGDKKSEYAHQGLFEEHYSRKRNGTSAPKERAYKSKMRNLNIDWAWVLTVHKAQGSQWDEVVVHDESFAFRSDASKWLYTGITRAAEKLTVVK